MNRKARRAARKHEPGFDNDGLVDQASDLSVFAKTLIADGDFGAALLPVNRLLDLSPTAEAKEMFLICMSSVQFESATPELHATLIRAVTEPWGSGNDLSKIVCPIIKLDPNIAADLASLRADPAAQLLPRSITAAAKNRLLLAALESLALRDAELELYLTECRAALLNDAVSPKMHGNLPPLAFTAALARQCFNNEYVFA